MRLKEQRLWDSFRKAAPPDVLLERIENLVSDGTPDVLVGIGGRWAWIENKAPEEPKRETTALMTGGKGLRQSQINWHVKAASLGLPSYVLIRGAHNKRIYLVSGKHALRLNQLTELEISALALNEKSKWDSVFEALRRRLNSQKVD